jgi:hypothetical protein
VKWILFVLLAWSGPLFAELRVEPAPPTEGQPLRISLTRQYFSESFVSEASITRTGNEFRITQTVVQSCFLPSAPVLTSRFDIGPLPSGTYLVTSVTTLVPGLPGCLPGPAILESTTFVVARPVRIPAASGWMLWLMAMGLVWIGTLWRRDS